MVLVLFSEIVWNWESHCAPRKADASEGNPGSMQFLIIHGGWAKKDVAHVCAPQEELSISHLGVFNCDSPE